MISWHENTHHITGHLCGGNHLWVSNAKVPQSFGYLFIVDLDEFLTNSRGTCDLRRLKLMWRHRSELNPPFSITRYVDMVMLMRALVALSWIISDANKWLDPTSDL